MSLLKASKSDSLNPRYEAADSIQLHGVTDAERDAKIKQVPGDIIFNSEQDTLQVYTAGSQWTDLGGGGLPTFTANRFLISNQIGGVGVNSSLVFQESFNNVGIGVQESSFEAGVTGCSILAAGTSSSLTFVDGAGISSDNSLIIGSRDITVTDSRDCFTMGRDITIDTCFDSIGIGKNVNITHDRVLLINNTASTVVNSAQDGTVVINGDNGVAINTNDPEGLDFRVDGSVAFKARIDVTGGTNVNDDDYHISVDTSAVGLKTVNVGTPTFTSGRTVIISDATGDAATNNIQVIGPGLVDGTKTIDTAYGGLMLVFNGVSYLSFNLTNAT